MKNFRFIGFMVLNLCFAPVISHAAPEKETTSSRERFSLNASVGYLSGTSKEFVYDESNGRKVSELDWEIKGAPVLRAEANYQLLQWLDLNARGWVTLSESNGVMNDYDWLNPQQVSWTDWSHHEDTSFRQGNEFDLNVRAWFFQQPSYQFAGMAGYQRTLFSFNAKSGCFIYNNGEEIGCFPQNQSIIGYKQVFETPYLGLAGKYRVNAFELNGLVKFSNWVDAQDEDQHYLRHLTFHERGSHFKYYNALINAGYFIKPQIKLFVEGTFSYIPNHAANSEVIDNSTGEREYAPVGAAGLQNSNYIIALGVQYK
jgi:plasminogen activator